MKYKYEKIKTVEDILNAIGRTDIPATDVTMTVEGDRVEIDFGAYVLPESDERKLEALMKGLGYKFKVKE